MNLGKALLSSIGSQITIPTVAGTPFQGGFYVGRMAPGDGFTYALIVAPRASGESSSLMWKTTTTSTSGTTSLWDGSANTAAMIIAGAAAHPAANFCKGLNIGGYTDWALPAVDQLELIYRQMKPTTTTNNTSSGANSSSDPVGVSYTSGVPGQTTITAFKTGGSEAFSTATYWTSTETSSSNAWIQLFNNGQQSAGAKTSSLYVRAVRMIKI